MLSLQNGRIESPSKEVEICRWRETSEAETTMDPLLDNRAVFMHPQNRNGLQKSGTTWDCKKVPKKKRQWRRHKRPFWRACDNRVVHEQKKIHWLHALSREYRAEERAIGKKGSFVSEIPTFENLRTGPTIRLSKATFVSPPKKLVVPSDSPCEKDFLLDSKTNMHVVNNGKLTWGPWKFDESFYTKKTKKNGMNLNIWLMLLQETPAILPLGKILEDHHWTIGQKPLQKKKKRIDSQSGFSSLSLLLHHLHHRIQCLMSKKLRTQRSSWNVANGCALFQLEPWNRRMTQSWCQGIIQKTTTMWKCAKKENANARQYWLNICSDQNADHKWMSETKFTKLEHWIKIELLFTLNSSPWWNVSHTEDRLQKTEIFGDLIASNHNVLSCKIPSFRQHLVVVRHVWLHFFFQRKNEKKTTTSHGPKKMAQLRLTSMVVIPNDVRGRRDLPVGSQAASALQRDDANAWAAQHARAMHQALLAANRISL